MVVQGLRWPGRASRSRSPIPYAARYGKPGAEGGLIDYVTDLEHTPLPFRIEPDIDGPPMPRLLSPAGCCWRGARLGGFARARVALQCTTNAGKYRTRRRRARLGCRPKRVYSPSVLIRLQNRSFPAHRRIVPYLCRPDRRAGSAIR